jgi:hypothetical protein
MLLLAVQIFDGETIDRQIRVGGEPALRIVDRDAEQLGVEPRRGLRGLGEQNLPAAVWR